MPVHSRSRKKAYFQNKEAKKVKADRRWVWLFNIIFPFVVVVMVSHLISSTTYFWDGKSKIVLSIADTDSDIGLISFDPIGDSVTYIKIPKETEVEVARSLGKWRIKNVPKLGQSEEVGGNLLSETLTKHFKFPSYTWANSQAVGFYKGDMASLFSTVFTTYDTNLGFGDRLKMAYFSMRTKNFKKEKIELKDTRYLKQVELTDGELGYVVSGSIPTNIAAIFADPNLVVGNERAKIVDRSEKNFVGEDVGEIVEVLGFKVLSISTDSPEDIDCVVSGQSTSGVRVVSKIFGCSIELNESLDVGIMITVGTQFERRY